MPKMPEPRIFAVGVSKTGTSSLNRALMFLGHVSLHYPGQYMERQAATKAMAIRTGDADSLVGRFGASDWRSDFWSALSNCNEHEYPECDNRYPGSKFILTTREADSWHTSLSRWWPHDRPGGKSRNRALASFMNKQRRRVWGSTEYQKNRMRELYEEHEAGVLSYFASRPNDLLVLPVETPDPEKWILLCDFLRLERHADQVVRRKINYPHRNVQDHDGLRKAKRRLSQERQASKRGPEALQALLDRRIARETKQDIEDASKGQATIDRRRARRQLVKARMVELRAQQS